MSPAALSLLVALALAAQDPDPWHDRLDRLEHTLDLFLQAPPVAGPAQKPRRRPRATRPQPAPPSLFVPITPPPPPEIRTSPPPSSPPVCRRCWTWAQVDAWRAFRQLAAGD